MRILFISFYFEPDLCAGSFRNTPLFRELRSQLSEDDFIHVITTQPNRYHSFKTNGDQFETGSNYEINRIKIPEHQGGMLDQAKSFFTFYRETKKLVKGRQYDLVYASSSRLFTAFLGRTIAASQKIPLYLDIRDIFVDTIKDVLEGKKFLQVPVLLFARFIEWYTFKQATHINLVSEGFRSYFKKYPKPSYSYYTNGIDDEFLKLQSQDLNGRHHPMTITYAGNIGSGQGLEKIVPAAAKALGENYQFKIIGDGGTKELLVSKLEELGVTNVELVNPVSRKHLIEHYQASTFLFLHLNDLEAFKKVLPSKIFEYGSFNKPVIAGVGGYAAHFIQDHLANYILFKPTEVDDFVSKMKAYVPRFENRDDFKTKFARENIMRKMATSIVETAKSTGHKVKWWC